MCNIFINSRPQVIMQFLRLSMSWLRVTMSFPRVILSHSHNLLGRSRELIRTFDWPLLRPTDCQDVKRENLKYWRMLSRGKYCMQLNGRLTGGLKQVSWRANLTLSSDVYQDISMFGLHERPLTYPCIIS